MFSRLSAYGGRANQYDVLKALALLSMTIDHVGWQLFPDALWMRGLGRLAFPLFFFLLGTHAEKPLRRDIWWWAIGYELFTLYMGRGLFPLNVLFTIGFSHAILYWMHSKGWIVDKPLGVVLATILFAFPCMILCEFGSLGLGFAVLGLLWHQKKQRGEDIICAVLLVVAYMVMQAYLYDLHHDVLALIAMVAPLLLCAKIVATCFSPKEGLVLFGPIDGVVRLLSRYALPYYVLHLIIIQLIAMTLYNSWPEGFSFSWVQ